MFTWWILVSIYIPFWPSFPCLLLRHFPQPELSQIQILKARSSCLSISLTHEPDGNHSKAWVCIIFISLLFSLFSIHLVNAPSWDILPSHSLYLTSYCGPSFHSLALALIAHPNLLASLPDVINCWTTRSKKYCWQRNSKQSQQNEW